MKKHLLLALLGFVFGFGTALADEVAAIDFKIGSDKTLRRVVIEFHEDAAPATVANFKKLARKGFYNGTAVHRVFPRQMVQMGDPQSLYHDRRNAGTGNPGYNLPAEINRHKHVRGTVSAARLPDKINPARLSNGSQFFITLTPLPNYDGQYTVFGKVIQGIETIELVSQLAADTNDNPLDRAVLESVRIVPRETASALKPKGTGPLRILKRVF